MKKLTILVILIVGLVATACSTPVSTPTPQPVEAESTVESPEATPADKQPAEPQPVEQAASQSDLIDYMAPRKLFTLSVPASWTKKTDEKTIKNALVETFTAPDGNAFMQILTNPIGNSMTKVLKGQVTLDYMKRLYGRDLRVASDITLYDGREKLEWWSDTNETSGTTYFNTGDKYLYFYSVAYKDGFEDDYASLLKEVSDSFSMHAYGAVSVEFSPSDMIAYVAPRELFTLSVPAAWTKQVDNRSIADSTVETFTSPDGNAFVQVLTNRVGNSMTKVLKGQVTLDYMKRLYGRDLRVATDVTLYDGREKLDWWSDTNETSGTTYFNTASKYLYFFTVGYKDTFKGDYASILKEVADSFSS